MGWTEERTASAQAFAGLGSLPSGTSTIFKDRGRRLLRLATALVETIAALDSDKITLERETAALRDRIAVFERSATLDGPHQQQAVVQQWSEQEDHNAEARPEPTRTVHDAERRPARPHGTDPDLDRDPGPYRGSRSVRLCRVRWYADGDRPSRRAGLPPDL